MKTKDWFSRFDLLRLRRQSIALPLVNLFFKTTYRLAEVEDRRKTKLLAPFLPSLCLSTLAAHAQVVNAIWTGTESLDWVNPLNWNPTGPPTETATFGPVTSGHTTSIEFSGGAVPGTFLFEDGAPQYSFTIEPGTLQLGFAGGTGVIRHHEWPGGDSPSKIDVQYNLPRKPWN
jgi:hypothetical protein